MLIDTAYRKYSGPMLQAMIRFSRDETAANDAVSQAFTQALVNRAMLAVSYTHLMNLSTVKSRLYKALKLLRLDLEEE